MRKRHQQRHKEPSPDGFRGQDGHAKREASRAAAVSHEYLEDDTELLVTKRRCHTQRREASDVDLQAIGKKKRKQNGEIATTKEKTTWKTSQNTTTENNKQPKKWVPKIGFGFQMEPGFRVCDVQCCSRVFKSVQGVQDEEKEGRGAGQGRAGEEREGEERVSGRACVGREGGGGGVGEEEEERDGWVGWRGGCGGGREEARRRKVEGKVCKGVHKGVEKRV